MAASRSGLLAAGAAAALVIVASFGCMVHIGDLVEPQADAASSDGAPVQDGSPTVSTAYRDAVLADGPIAYFRLGEASGTTALDESGRGNHARYSGNVVFGAPGALASDPDPAVAFDGTTASVSGVGSFDPSETRPFTIEGWVKPLLVEGSARYFIARESSTPAGRQNVGLALHPTKGVVFERHVDGAPVEVVGSAPNDRFFHVVGTYDGAVLALYVDGALVGTAPDARPAPATEALVLIGGADFKGALDEIAIYDKALSAERVKVHHELGASAL